MRHICIVLFFLLGILTACNRHSEEGLYTPLSIVSEIEPQSKLLYWIKMTPEERQKYPRRGFVINSVSEFPDEPNINMTDLKLMDIDFNRYTLLVHYTLIPGYVQGHQLYWFYDNHEDRYEFQSNFKIVYPDEDVDAENELFTYYRSAIIVNKIMSDKDVSFTFSY